MTRLFSINRIYALLTAREMDALWTFSEDQGADHELIGCLYAYTVWLPPLAFEMLRLCLSSCYGALDSKTLAILTHCVLKLDVLTRY